MFRVQGRGLGVLGLVGRVDCSLAMGAEPLGLFRVQRICAWGVWMLNIGLIIAAC